jgi:hypothetical protein
MMFTAESEMAMSEEEFRLIREIIHSIVGSPLITTPNTCWKKGLPEG